MNRRSDRVGDIRPRLLSRRGEPIWLHDRARGAFLDPGPPVGWEPEIGFRLPGPPPRPKLTSRLGRVVHWLFACGGVTIVFLGGIMAFALIALSLGYR